MPPQSILSFSLKYKTLVVFLSLNCVFEQKLSGRISVVSKFYLGREYIFVSHLLPGWLLNVLVYIICMCMEECTCHGCMDAGSVHVKAFLHVEVDTLTIEHSYFFVYTYINFQTGKFFPLLELECTEIQANWTQKCLTNFWQVDG